MPDTPPPESSIVLYQTEDGRTRIQCRFEDETIWLSQALIADLFQVTVPTVNEHLKGIFAEGELPPEATIRNFRIVRLEGARQVTRDIEHYSLPAILAVGYAGQVSAETARSKAEREYERYRALVGAQPRPVDQDFEQATRELTQLSKNAKSSRRTAVVKESLTTRSRRRKS